MEQVHKDWGKGGLYKYSIKTDLITYAKCINNETFTKNTRDSVHHIIPIKRKNR